MPAESFQGLRVLSFESRRATEMATLISTYGGQPTVAPALREVPIESNTQALEFAAALLRGEFDMVVLLTGVGTRFLLRVVEQAYPREAFLDALRKTKVVARGPKPMAVLRELQVPAWLSVPEPNTWRELLAAIDTKTGEEQLRGMRVAVQEYGVANIDLINGLGARGADVTQVPVYQWALPENVEPLRSAVTALSRSEVDVTMFTTATQVVHLFQVAREMQLEEAVRRGLAACVIGSIGPTTSEELRCEGLAPDLEPSHPKMGFLVKETAERSIDLLRRKR